MHVLEAIANPAAKKRPRLKKVNRLSKCRQNKPSQKQRTEFRVRINSSIFCFLLVHMIKFVQLFYLWVFGEGVATPFRFWLSHLLRESRLQNSESEFSMFELSVLLCFIFLGWRQKIAQNLELRIQSSGSGF